MNNEEMNKKMEFIVEHQAKFAAGLDILREVQARDAKLLKDGVLGLVDIMGSLARAQESAEKRITLLTEAQTRTGENINRLTETQARTEASLNILINTVERHIGGNGGSHSHA